MKLPKIEIVFMFLHDYLFFRSQDWEATSEQLVNVGKLLYNGLTTTFNQLMPSAHPAKLSYNKDAKTMICDTFMESFLNAKTPEQWMNIAFDLGKDAREILKSDPSSLLGRTLHAVRTFIIASMQKEPAYEAKIRELRGKLLALDNQIYQHRSQGLDVTLIKATRRTTLYQLADLQEDRAIFECDDLGLFDPQSFPETQNRHELTYSHELVNNAKTNINKPLHYQSHYFQLHHEEAVKAKKKETFEQFLKRAVQEFPKALEEHTQRQKAPHLVLIEDEKGVPGSNGLSENNSSLGSSNPNGGASSSSSGGKLNTNSPITPPIRNSGSVPPALNLVQPGLSPSLAPSIPSSSSPANGGEGVLNTDPQNIPPVASHDTAPPDLNPDLSGSNLEPPIPNKDSSISPANADPTLGQKMVESKEEELLNSAPNGALNDSESAVSPALTSASNSSSTGSSTGYDPNSNLFSPPPPIVLPKDNNQENVLGNGQQNASSSSSVKKRGKGKGK